MKFNKFIIKIRLLTIIALILFLLCACGGNDGDALAVGNASTPRPVKAIQLKPITGNKTRIFPGTAKALQDTQLSFRVGGPLIELNAETGQYIERDALIAKIDPRDFIVRINSLEARLDASRAQQAESRLQYLRYEHLIKENAAAKATYDQIKAAYEIAEAQVRADEKNLENAKNALADTRLHAPFSGYVDKQFVENHQIVGAGQPIVSLVDLSTMEVDVALPEDMLPDLKRFESFTCRFEALPERTFIARFKEIGKQPNGSNRTYPLTLTIADAEKTSIRPGMAAEVTIRISLEDQNSVFAVPVSAVGNDHNRQSFAWIADPETGSLSKKPVTVHGFAPGGRIEVSGDFSAGQWMVVAGVNSLTEDQKIRLLTSPSITNVGNEL